MLHYLFSKKAGKTAWGVILFIFQWGIVGTFGGNWPSFTLSFDFEFYSDV